MTVYKRSLNKRLLQHFRDILFLLLGVGLLILAFQGYNFGKMMRRFLEVNYWWILLAKLISLFAHYIRAVRWKMLIEPLGERPNTNNLFYATMVGYLVNIVTPKLGDIARSLAVKRTDGTSAPALLGTLIVERAIDVLMLVLILLSIFLFHIDLLSGFFVEHIATPFQNNLLHITHHWGVVLVITGVSLVVLVLYLFTIRQKLYQVALVRKMRSLFQSVLKGVETILHLKHAWRFIGYTLFMWFLYFFSFYISFFAIKETAHLSFSNAIFTQAFSGVGWAMPVHAGIGAFHWAVTQALVLLKISYENGLVFATVVHTTAILLNLIAGGVCLVIILIKVGRSLNIRDIKSLFSEKRVHGNSTHDNGT